VPEQGQSADAEVLVVTVDGGPDLGPAARSGAADSGQVRRELSLGETAPVIGSIGRLEPIKGYDVMVEAFAQFREMNPSSPAVLVLAGEGSRRRALEELAAARGLAGRVHFLGWRDDVHELQSTFQIFTMSSRSEGTSISLLEAMSAELAPVVTDVGGNSEVLGPALAHCLVPSEDPAALARAWAERLSNPRLRARDASLARERVVSSFGVEAMVEAYARVYSGPENPVSFSPSSAENGGHDEGQDSFHPRGRP